MNVNGIKNEVSVTKTQAFAAVTHCIQGSELVTQIFGCWPSFQNAEIHWLRLTNSHSEQGVVPTIEFQLHSWEMTNEVSPQGYYVQRNNILVHFRFREIDNLLLYDFNCENAILRLSISPLADPQLRPKYKVEIKSARGLGGSFTCRDITVLSVQPCDEEGNPCSKNQES